MAVATKRRVGIAHLIATGGVIVTGAATGIAIGVAGLDG